MSGQIGDNLRVRGAFNNSWSKIKGLLPSLNGTDPADGIDVNYLKTSTFPNWTLSGTMDYIDQPEAVPRRARRLLPVRSARHGTCLMSRDTCGPRPATSATWAPMASPFRRTCSMERISRA